MTEADGWVLYSFTTSISTSGNYDLVFTTTGQTDCYINFTGTTQFQTLLLNKPPWARYSASNWSETTLTDLTTNARHATTANLTTTTGSGNGATASITYLTGTSTGSIRFPPGSLPTTYTVCSITSLTTSGGPLLQSGPSNPFLCGHWGNQRGIVYYNGVWITPEVSIGTPTDFVNVVTTNSESVAIPNNALIDGTGYATSNSGSHTANFLTINNGGWVTSTTPFRFSQLIIFDQGLTTEEMYIVSNALKTYLTSGVLQ